MKFSQLSLYFDQISQKSSRLEITRILAELFEKLSHEEIEKVVYLLQGKVRPSYEGIDFGMAEKMIVKAGLIALNIEKSCFEKEFKKVGDLGRAMEHFKNEIRSFEEREMEIGEVYDMFYKLATSSGEGSQEAKINYLAQLIRTLDPVSSRFLARLPTGVIRMGFSDMTVLDAFSWMVKGDKSLRNVIEKAYHVRPELGYIGRVIKEKGIVALEKIQPKVFTPIIMMRAERMSSAFDIVKQLGQCLVESKFDGFRLQAHFDRKQDRVKLFSRSLEDVTHMYPDIVEGLKEQVKADTAILEGEAIGYSPETKAFLPFQETVQRKRKYDVKEMAKKIPLKLFCFELLYLNGTSFINVPFSKRRQALEKIIASRHDLTNETVLVADEQKVNEEKKLEDLFDEAVSKGLEGIMAKKSDGVYKPGAREWNWIKYKKSYSSKVSDTIDCLVMGYDFGKGKRTAFGVGAFLVGVYDDKKEKFLTIAKIGTGLTDVEWRSLKQKSEKITKDEKPENYEVNKMMECDVWLSPEIVVEIRADEITRSPVHSSGFALRFPRLERFRKDKKEKDATAFHEIKSMFEASKRTGKQHPEKS